MIRVGRLRGLFDPFLDALPSLGTLAVLVVGVIRLRQGAVDIEEVVSVAFLFTVLAFPVRAIGWVLTELPRSVVGWERVQHVLTATGDMPYGQRTLTASAGRLRRCACGSRFSATTAARRCCPMCRSTCRPGRRWHWSARPVRASRRSPRWPPAWSTRRRAGRDRRGGRPGADRRGASPRRWRWCPQVPFVFDDTVGGNVALGSGTAWTTTPRGRRCGWPRPTGSSTGSRTGQTRWSASAVRRCPAANASG